MSTYAAYANIVNAQRTGSVYSSRRVSENSNASVESANKKPSRFQRFLTQLKPADEAVTPTGVYTPLIKHKRIFVR